MTLPYAFFTDGRASGIPIALWSCNAERGTAKQNFELGFAPIAGAYVACVQVSEGRASVPIRPEFIRYGRTNKVGWVVRRERDALGGEQDEPEARAPLVDEPPPTWFLNTDPVVFEVPEGRADRTLLYGLPNERYRIFWTYDSVRFEQFASELEEDAARTLDIWRVDQYAMEPFGRPPTLGGLNFLSEWERGAVPRLLFPGERLGYHAGWYFKDMFTPAIFDATPASFRALYACEWLQWCCERLVQDEPDWPYLWSLAGVIRAAESGAPIPDLAKMLPAGGEMGKRAAEMRAYVYECAKRGIRARDRMVNAVTVGSEVSTTGLLPGLGGWRAAAASIAEEVGLVHPALAHEAHLDQFYFSETTKAALVAYFDMYAMGFDHQADAGPIAAHVAHIREALDWIREKQRTMLESFSHPQLMEDLALYVPPSDFALRLELGDRYHFHCANVDLRFWERADRDLATQDAWDKLAPHLAWLGEGSDLLAQMFDGLLDRYVATYRQTAESVETMVRYLYRYHWMIQGNRAEQTLPQSVVTVRLEYDPIRDLAVAKVYQGARSTLLGEYELFTRLASAPAGEAHAPLGPTHSDDGLKLFRRAMHRGKVRGFVLAERSLEVPHADVLSGFPKALATAGALIKSGLALGALIAEAKTKKFGDIELDVYLELAEESFQALEPGADILNSVLMKAGKSAQQAASHPFVRAGTALSKVGGVIEASRNLIAGGQTLATLLAPARSDTDLAHYLERGEVVPAWLEGTKGTVQVATGSAGFGALLLGASTTVATLPLSALVAVGSVAVATLNVLIYVHTGGGSPVDAYLNAVREARRKQLKLSTGNRILKPDEDVVPGEVVAGSGGTGSTAICRFARSLGMANEIAKQARLGRSARGAAPGECQRGS